MPMRRGVWSPCGQFVGELVTCIVGLKVGRAVDKGDGLALGRGVGTGLGKGVGFGLGAFVGTGVGTRGVGFAVGILGVGLIVGADDGFDVAHNDCLL